jgi:hypothetical protein
MLWQGIHFLNVFSPAAISPATDAPAEDASATIAIKTIFIMPRDPYSADPLLLGLTLGREPTTPKRDVKGLRTILLVAAVQTALTAFSDEIQARSSPRCSRLMHGGGVSKSVPILRRQSPAATLHSAQQVAAPASPAPKAAT